MFLDNDVVANGETLPGSLAGIFGGKKRIENTFANVLTNAGACIGDTYFNMGVGLDGRDLNFSW